MRLCPKCGEPIEDPFDSCWKCAGKPEPAEPAVAQVPRLTWKFFILAAFMSVLAVLLADFIQYDVLASRAGAFDQKFLWYVVIKGKFGAANPGLAGYIAIRTIITFVILCQLVKLGFRDRTVWMCLAGWWTIVNFLLLNP